MKTKVWFLVILVCFGLIVWSCSKEDKFENKTEVVNSLDEDDGFTALWFSVEAYNAKFDAQCDATRGRFWNFLKRCFRVIGSDILGLGTGWAIGGPAGGIYCGIAGSICAGASVSVNGEPAFVPNMEEKYYIYNIGEEILSANKDFGVIHNQIIRDIYSESNYDFSALSQSQIINLVRNKLQGYGYECLDEIEAKIPDILEDVDEILALINDDGDLTPAVRKIAELYPQYRHELTIALEYCKKVVELQDEETRAAYTDGFLNLIDDADISEDSRNILENAVSVGANSSVLWEAVD